MEGSGSAMLEFNHRSRNGTHTGIPIPGLKTPG